MRGNNTHEAGTILKTPNLNKPLFSREYENPKEAKKFNRTTWGVVSRAIYDHLLGQPDSVVLNASSDTVEVREELRENVVGLAHDKFHKKADPIENVVVNGVEKVFAGGVVLGFHALYHTIYVDSNNNAFRFFWDHTNEYSNTAQREKYPVFGHLTELAYYNDKAAKPFDIDVFIIELEAMVDKLTEKSLNSVVDAKIKEMEKLGIKLKGTDVIKQMHDEVGLLIRRGKAIKEGIATLKSARNFLDDVTLSNGQKLSAEEKKQLMMEGFRSHHYAEGIGEAALYSVFKVHPDAKINGVSLVTHAVKNQITLSNDFVVEILQRDPITHIEELRNNNLLIERQDPLLYFIDKGMIELQDSHTFAKTAGKDPKNALKDAQTELRDYMLFHSSDAAKKLVEGLTSLLATYETELNALVKAHAKSSEVAGKVASQKPLFNKDVFDKATPEQKFEILKTAIDNNARLPNPDTSYNRGSDTIDPIQYAKQAGLSDDLRNQLMTYAIDNNKKIDGYNALDYAREYSIRLMHNNTEVTALVYAYLNNMAIQQDEKPIAFYYGIEMQLGSFYEYVQENIKDPNERTKAYCYALKATLADYKLVLANPKSFDNHDISSIKEGYKQLVYMINNNGIKYEWEIDHKKVVSPVRPIGLKTELKPGSAEEKFLKTDAYTLARKIQNVQRKDYKNKNALDFDGEQLMEALLTKCDIDMALKFIEIGEHLSERGGVVDSLKAFFDATLDLFKRVLPKGLTNRISRDEVVDVFTTIIKTPTPKVEEAKSTEKRSADEILKKFAEKSTEKDTTRHR